MEQASNPAGGAGADRPRLAFYNVAETADLLRMDQSTLYRHLRSGRFPAVKIGGRYVVPRQVVERLVDEVIAAGRCVDVAEWAARAALSGGAA
ncbi:MULTISPECIES: helix-turn-helix domain-containing protein [Prauserella salsuginis group]|uniref:Helix-turn-helix domain-containing protein n=1 Tax=Prauserella salsuginis TaxID=387889 RepID=A0ABW6FW09_9PSEU|nr:MULTISPECIES: helix-turn-helix domain-containing protein [Prauserella salsuginis group]MCR3720169.1 DNA binding domain-containing protein, excisionase family [Prauserella flava]MCR3734122.1 DNA binding domain-containing protein, excisionase family [Prauserella salsuginis]